MNNREIILTFVLAMAIYVVTVFMWPSSTNDLNKGARLAGPPSETAFLRERFGVPSPDQDAIRIE
ncbi:MAG: hypothetical protein ACK4N1_07670 [Pseudorhizobium sp.]